MKKIEEHQQLLQNISYLINKMESEIDYLRNITYRYYLMHGEKIQNGLVDIPDYFNIEMNGVNHEDLKCELINYKDLNITSDYQIIKRKIKELNN